MSISQVHTKYLEMGNHHQFKLTPGPVGNYNSDVREKQNAMKWAEEWEQHAQAKERKSMQALAHNRANERATQEKKNAQAARHRAVLARTAEKAVAMAGDGWCTVQRVPRRVTETDAQQKQKQTQKQKQKQKQTQKQKQK